MKFEMKGFERPFFVEEKLNDEQVAELKQYVNVNFNTKLYYSFICGKHIYWSGIS